MNLGLNSIGGLDQFQIPNDGFEVPVLQHVLSLTAKQHGIDIVLRHQLTRGSQWGGRPRLQPDPRSGFES